MTQDDLSPTYGSDRDARKRPVRELNVFSLGDNKDENVKDFTPKLIPNDLPMPSPKGDVAPVLVNSPILDPTTEQSDPEQLALLDTSGAVTTENLSTEVVVSVATPVTTKVPGTESSLPTSSSKTSPGKSSPPVKGKPPTSA